MISSSEERTAVYIAMVGVEGWWSCVVTVVSAGDRRADRSVTATADTTHRSPSLLMREYNQNALTETYFS